VTKFEYHGETIHNGVNGAAIPTLAAGTTLKYEIVGKTLTNNETFQDVESTGTIQFKPKTGQIRYLAQDKDFVGGIYTIKATYTINETFNDLQGEVQYTSYWTFYAPAYTAPKQIPDYHVRTGYFTDTGYFYFKSSGEVKNYTLPSGYLLFLTATYAQRAGGTHDSGLEYSLTTKGDGKNEFMLTTYNNLTIANTEQNKFWRLKGAGGAVQGVSLVLRTGGNISTGGSGIARLSAVNGDNWMLPSATVSFLVHIQKDY
ncbi:MAG: hypothetical protein LBH55_02455, partial [Mycoplasmataceae bacterium]|nr:hypothetical protein [Mycoplasmataceae bacterium]